MSPALESVNSMIAWAGTSQNLAFYLIIESYFFYSEYELRQARAELMKAGRPDLIRQAYQAGHVIKFLNKFDSLPVTKRKKMSGKWKPKIKV